MNKRAELLELIDSNKPHIIFGTETWLSQSIHNNEIIPDDLNYSIYRKDREDSHGGVMIAVLKSIPSLHLPNLNTLCEILWVKLSFNTSKDVYAAVFYRPHLSDLASVEQLNLSLEKLENSVRNPQIWLSGDFNAPHIDWSIPLVTPGSPHCSTQQLLVDVVQDHGLTQVINEPTRLANILDLFLTNSPEQIQDITIIPGLSDHEAVVIEANVKPPLHRQPSRKIPLYNKANWQAIKADIQHLQHDISNMTTTSDITANQIWERFRNAIQNSISKYIPHKTARKRCSVPWISTHLRRKIKKRNKLYRQAKQLNSPELHNKFLDLKHSIQRDLRISHQKYLNNIILPSSDNNRHCKQISSHSGKIVLTSHLYLQVQA